MLQQNHSGQLTYLYIVRASSGSAFISFQHQDDCWYWGGTKYSWLPLASIPSLANLSVYDTLVQSRKES